MATRRVLVLGDDTRAFLAVIRSLGRCGFEVHVAWCSLDAPALRSRYVSRVHRIPLYQVDDTRWIDAFRELLIRESFDLVLPTTDSTILPLQLHQSQFNALTKLCVLPDDVFHVCSDKYQTYELASREGIPLARQRTITSLPEAVACAADFGYPVVLKPRRSAVKQNPLARQKVRKAANEGELVRWAAEMMAPGGVLVQENFVGRGVGVEVLCKDGRILTAFQHERIHEALTGGMSSYRASVALHEGMYQAAERLMRALRYTGVAMVEYKHNHEARTWILIEINARFWGSLPLSIAAGLDFPRYLAEMLLDGREEVPRNYRVGMFARHWSSDIQWFIANLRADRRDPLLHTRKISSLILEVGNIIRLRERSDTLAIDDWRPAWHDLRQYFGEKLFVVLKRMAPYRRLQQRKLFHLYRRAGTILVMCYGNICRSPFAGHLLSGVTDKKVMSGGTYPKSGRQSPPEAVEAARSLGIDLESHQSRIISADEVEQAGLIIIFDRKNWLAVRSLCPGAMRRVAYLGAADPDGPLEVGDPFGSSSAGFQDCYTRIHTLITRLAQIS